MADILTKWSGINISLPEGGFYLWFKVDDAWGFTERLAREAGTLVSPGDLYGEQGQGFIRVAVVQSDETIERVAQRLGVS
jgi:LL-diaminopimelate aminotransferase